MSTNLATYFNMVDIMIQFIRKVLHSEQKEKTVHTKDKAGLNVILSNCTKTRTFSQICMEIVFSTFNESGGDML